MSDSVKKINLNNNLVLELEENLNLAVRFNDLEGSQVFLRYIWPEVEADKNFINQSPELHAKLKRIYDVCSILLMVSRSEPELVEVFRKGIIYYYRDYLEDFNIWDLLKGKLLIVFPHQDRDKLKKKLQQALLENEQPLTNGKLPDINGELVRVASIKNWIVDYLSVVGNQSVDAAAISDYFAKNKVFQKLSDQDKLRVRSLLGLYERLKLSSLTPRGIEESFNVVDEEGSYIFTEGRFEQVDPKIRELTKKMFSNNPAQEFQENTVDASLDDGQLKKPLIAENKSPENIPTEDESHLEKDQEEIIKAYQGDPAKYQAIVKEEERLRSKLGDKTSAIRQEFFSAVQKKQVTKTIACLKVLAEKNDLSSFVKEDEKLNVFLKAVWQKRYGEEFIQEFDNNPGQPKYIKLFLRYVLEERLGLSENDSARVGAQIGNTFANLGQQEFTQMAFFDLSTKQFKWFDE